MNIGKLYLLLTTVALAVSPVSLRALDTVAVPTPNANLDLARQLNQAFVQVADEVSPAVVVITVTQKSTSTHATEGQDDEDDPLDQFRRFLQQQQQPDQQSPSPPEKSTAQGSGIIIRGNGYILTNRHVVEDADTIEVRLKDGRVFKNAVVRGVDAPADVAVIKIDANDLPIAKLADSDQTRVGEFAIAIGAPFALDYSVTFGHVSAKNRSNIIVPDGANSTAMMDQSFIQTDANINPGNSGGPLVNIEGEVIGINTLIRGLHTGIGFAIPINLAREIADQIIAEGKFTRSWLGIAIQSLREYPEFSGLIKSVQDGVVVKEIVPDGPAAKSDLRPADVITSVDGKPIITAQQLKDAIRAKKVGRDITLEVVRRTRNGEKQMKILVKPAEWVDKTEVVASGENSAGEKSGNTNPLGVSVKAITPELARKYNVDPADGVIVTAVERGGLAAEYGILEGDIITSIDEHPTATPRQFHDAAKNVNTKKGAIIHLISAGTAKFEVLKDTAD